MRGPLGSVLVADFSRVLAGPLATATLADLGATVVKVEKPGTGDDTRGWGPPWVDAPGGTAAYFHAANRSKRSVVLDLTDERDRGLAHELAARADVVVENFKHGTMGRHGLGYQQVAAANPGVVYCSGQIQEGEHWIHQSILYRDTYERRGGRWYFVRRVHELFHGVAAPVHPLEQDPANWPERSYGRGTAPASFPTWGDFWEA